MKLADPHKRTVWMRPEEWDEFRALDPEGNPRPTHTVVFEHCGRSASYHHFRGEAILAQGNRAQHWLVRCGWSHTVDEGIAPAPYWGGSG